MNKLLRSLRRRYLQWTNAKTVSINGVRIVTEQGAIPQVIRNELFRDKYEDTERNLLLQFLRPGMRVVEIGTGIGFIGLLASRIVGQDNVFCYEANRDLEAIIRRNHQLNGLMPDLTMKAVTVDGLPVAFFKSDNVISSSIYDRSRGDKQITVDSVAFREVIETRSPDVLIMDVEGAEVDLLGLSSLGNLQHIIVELHPHIVGEDKISSTLLHLKGMGYNVEARDRKTAYLRRTVTI